MSKECQISKSTILNLNLGFDLTFELWHLTFDLMIHQLIQLPLAELQSEAFRLRKKHFGNELTFSIPGTVTYRDSTLPTQRDRFTPVSVTGSHCDLGCSHCKGKLLEAMIPAKTPDTFLQVANRLRLNGAHGILVSGGADHNGQVPLDLFIPSIKTIKEKHPTFKVIVHTGLIRRKAAEELKQAGVDQILIDVIGDDDTIRDVYRLNKTVEDYEKTLWMLKEMGHRLAPHIIMGHHFGEIRGEWKALELVTRVGVETIVLVVFKTLNASDKDHFKLPNPEETSKICAIARILDPSIPIRLGCIRPAHPWKAAMEKGAIDSGIDTIAHPLQGTIDYAKEIGLKTKFSEMCCSLV